MEYKKWPLIAGIGCFSGIIAVLCSGITSRPTTAAAISAGDVIKPAYSIDSGKTPASSAEHTPAQSVTGQAGAPAPAAPASSVSSAQTSYSSSAASSSSSASAPASSSSAFSSTAVSSAPQSSQAPAASSSEPEPEYVPPTPYVRPPEYEDPDSYLQLDPATWTYVLTPEEEAIAAESLFVGDSTCYGFSAWGVAPARNVYAAGGAAARNILDFDCMFYLGRQIQLPQVLSETKPKRVFFWMGMNDVNMTSETAYCENYKKIIDIVLEQTKAEVYVCAITPISDLYFTDPARIELFNSSIKEYISANYTERVHTVNFAEPLKDSRGLLDEQYNGGDGIHLRSKAYYVAMHEINRQIKLCET